MDQGGASIFADRRATWSFLFDLALIIPSALDRLAARIRITDT
jgi:hypothetical protein